MSARKSEKRGHRFYGVLSDPWRKLISIGLGVLVWYYLNNQVTAPHSGDVTLVFNQDGLRADHLEIRLDSTGFTHKRFLNDDGTRKETDTIKLDFKGGNRLISELEKSGRMKFVVKFSEDHVQNTNPPILKFGLEDIHHKTRPEFDALLSRMTPRNVLVELERNERKNLLLKTTNVELTLDRVIDDGRIQEATFKPVQLDIFGPVELIQRIGSDTKLFKATISARDIKTRSEISFQLELADEFEQSGIQLTLPHVTYKVEPERVRFKLLEIPVVLDRERVPPGAGALYEVKHKTVNITIGVSGRLFEDLLEHFKIGQEEHEVPPSWCREHARMRVYLRLEDLKEDTITERTPTLELFDLDRNDEEKKRYLLGREFVVLAQSHPLIEIQKRKK